jgi:hypothetical protein
MTALAASLSLRAPPTDTASAARLEDLVCSTNTVSAFVTAAVRKAAAAQGGSLPAAASPAVAALERAASSLADNLHSCFGRFGSATSNAALRMPSPQHSSSSSSPRSWGDSQVCTSPSPACTCLHHTCLCLVPAAGTLRMQLEPTMDFSLSMLRMAY